jgi:hypothetical protein
MLVNPLKGQSVPQMSHFGLSGGRPANGDLFEAGPTTAPR